MAVALKQLARAGRTALPAALSLALGAAAHGAPPDLSAFIGSWTFQVGGAFGLTCAGLGAVPPRSIAGTNVSIYPSPTADLTFDIGCGCKLDLDVDTSGTVASLATTPQACRVVPKGEFISGMIRQLTLDFSAAPLLTLSLSGDNASVTTLVVSCPASADSTFFGSGTLARTSTSYVTCGSDADDVTVGILPTWSRGTTDCPFGAGMEGVQIAMHDEQEPPCSDQAGSRGEGPWLLPDDAHDRKPVCGSSYMTSLSFCRVDGTRFRPMTTADDPAQYYALLKLGKSCPNGSIELTKTIDNEDGPTGIPSFASPNAGPNQVQADPTISTFTKLVFCYFRAAASADASMSAFPDFGFPYAVFHRFKGEQPAWVIAKSWQYSNDEDSQNAADSYEPPGSPITREFEDVIENPNNNTFFDLARVR